MESFAVGDKVKFAQDKNFPWVLPYEGDIRYTVIAVEDVPVDQIQFDERTGEGGVGHPQWVRIDDSKKTLYSGLFFVKA